MTRPRLAGAAFAAALVAAAVLAPAPAAAQTVDARFAQALSLCVDHYPDLSRARGEAIRAGFAFEGRADGIDYYSAHRQQLLAGFDGSGEARCVFGLDGLRDEAAVAAAEAALAARAGAPLVRLGPSEDGRYIAGWLLDLPSGGMFVGVTRQVNFSGRFRGSIIVVRSAAAVVP